MAIDKRITQLPAIATVEDADLAAFVDVTSGITSKVAALQIKDYTNFGQTGGKLIYGGLLTSEDLALYNNENDSLGVVVQSDGVLRVNAPTYESLVIDDDDIPNKKYVDDSIVVENLWDRVTGTPNYLVTHNAGDEIGASGAPITKGYFTGMVLTNLDFVAGGSQVNEIVTVVDGSSTDSQLATAKAVEDRTSAVIAKRDNLTVSSPGQTAFTLSQTPSGNDAFGLFLNGNSVADSDYSFVGTALTYSGTALKTTDRLLAWYDWQSPSLLPSLPQYIAYNSLAITNLTGDGTTADIIFDSTDVNVGGAYNTGTGVFTAAQAGTYKFNILLFLGLLTASHVEIIVDLEKSGVAPNNRNLLVANPGAMRSGTSNNLSFTGSVELKINAGETVKFRIQIGGGTKTVSILTTSIFSGRRLT